MSNTPRNTKTTDEQTQNINMSSKESIFCAVSGDDIMMEMQDGLSNNDAMAMNITDQNDGKYLSYSHEGAGYKTKVPT